MRRVRALALSVFVACGACGTISNQPPPELPGPAPAAPLADGEWHWQLEHTEDGVQRLESERWYLSSHGDELRGYYDRRVTLRSVAGLPFRCNQSSEYQLVTRYFVIGTQNGAQVVLHEQSHQSVPSPCETDERRHTEYRGTLAPGQLRLEWDGGTQVLARTDDARPPEPLPVSDPAVKGAWQWTTEHGARAEVEAWLLQERDGGTIVGSYRRTVTDGDCAIVERYRVHGNRVGNRLSLAETEVSTEPAECEAHHGQRSLDSARGTSYGDTIVLVWRGGRRQVLTRPR